MIIGNILDEEGIRGQPKGLGQVRLDAVQAEPAGHGTGRDAVDRPMLWVLQWVAFGGGLLQGPIHHLGDPFFIVSAWAAGAEIGVQA